MSVPLYMDVHIPVAITEQLRLRGVNVLTATEESTNQLSDDVLLETAFTAGRLLFTHDIRFRAMAEQWQRDGRQFAGLAYGHAEGASIGQYVRDLELIAKASEPSEWRNAVIYLPL
jgi:Domain of unknown function (DUF5615)